MFNTPRRVRQSINVWPGYVDALAALLMLVIFVLLVFTFSQFLLSHILSTQESELSTLHRQLNEITEALGMEQEKNQQMQNEIVEFNQMIAQLTEEKFELSSQVTQLNQQIADDETKLTRQLQLIASLQQDIDTLRQLRDQLESQVGALSAQLDESRTQATRLRDRSKALEARLAEQTDMTHLAQKDIEQRDIRIEALSALVGSQQQALDEERQLSASSQAEIALLSQQLERLKAQLRQIDDALKLSEAEKLAQEEQIRDLGRRLNIELARKVNELEQYRSDFFGQLRTLLADNPNIQIEGDRFVFPAELLFGSGSAELGEGGRRQLDTLAQVLKDVIRQIPQGIDWILRIDGHTDRVPIRSGVFASNWELSSARALSVLLHLAGQGIPRERMAAAGFGEFHPIDPAGTAEAYRKNRRIEIKLTSR